MLLNRQAERQTLDRMLDDVRGGLSGALVLRGEAGIGKTVLLEYAVDSAADLRVARVVGVESEMELGFAALHQLIVPFLPQLGGLPTPQRDALRSAFGLRAGPPPDRFLVGLAVLTLLAAAAEDQPLLCAVDDAQWLDCASAEVLAFVARRLQADSIAFVFAVAEPADRRVPLDGLPDLCVAGLDDDDARQLLTSAVACRLDDSVGQRIIAETGGNPLALVELSSELTPNQLAGLALLPEHLPLPLGNVLQHRFLRRVQALPADAQSLLQLAAADPSGDPRVFEQAAANLGLSRTAAAPAVAGRLLVLEPRVAFRHPLIRSAVYHGASSVDRRRCHEALAAASDPDKDADRRAWHLAAAALGPDEDVAAELERSADRARRRGGHAAAAAYLSRASELTPDRPRQAERLLGAAQAQLTAGSPAMAQALLERALPELADRLGQAQAERLQGAIRFASGQGGETPVILLRAASVLAPLDVRLARQTLLEALEAGHWAGQFGSGGGVGAVAEAARTIRPDARTGLTPADFLLDGLSAALTGDRGAGAPLLRRAIAALDSDQLRPDEGLRWLGLGYVAAGELFDDVSLYALVSRWVRLSRDQGALSTLPFALGVLGGCEVLAGRFAVAETCFAEGRDISMATDNPGVLGSIVPQQLLLMAWRGRESATRSAASTVTRDAIARSQGKVVTFAQLVLAVLELGLGHYQAALACSLSAYEVDPLYLGTLGLPDLVESAVRSDNRPLADAALERLSQRVATSGTPLALGLLARSRALLAADDAAEDAYQEAIDHLRQTASRPDLARAHLVYGEWLRRQRRRRHSRDELRIAHEMFESMGAEGFAERARIELLATGERARKRSVETRDALTPQEAQIAWLAMEGDSNPEIAAQLFLSPSTVEYHLRKVFRKLGVTSRNQLGRALRQPVTAGRP